MLLTMLIDCCRLRRRCRYTASASPGASLAMAAQGHREGRCAIRLSLGAAGAVNASGSALSVRARCAFSSPHATLSADELILVVVSTAQTILPFPGMNATCSAVALVCCQHLRYQSLGSLGRLQAFFKRRPLVVGESTLHGWNGRGVWDLGADQQAQAGERRYANEISAGLDEDEGCRGRQSVFLPDETVANGHRPHRHTQDASFLECASLDEPRPRVA